MIKRLVYFLIVVLVLGAAYALAQTLIGNASSETPNQGSKGAAPKVLVEPVVFESTGSSFGAIATGWAGQSTDIYAVVDEKVSKVLFKSQQKVKRGDLLVQQDDREEQLALRLAQVQLKNTQSLLERYKQAVGKGAVPQTQVDSAQADFEAAQVAVEQARLAISFHQIRAPFDGVVGITDIDPGQRIGPDVLVTGIDSREIIYVDFDVPEAIISQLNPDSMDQIQVTATTPAVAGKQFDAAVVALDSRLDAEKRTLRVRANINNSEDLLRPGMSFSVQMAVKGQMLAAVPEIALQWDREGSYVWLVRDGKADRVNLRVADRRQGKVFLEGDIREGDSVVVEGGLRLSEGVQVELVEDPLQ
ncbi:efflux RND transporter periplasmic adaptor subunit [Limnobacter parvus]|uniref:Efflux RND transporter periplasmic adaptor subunit n=1 Tax=Limnobacter parvus TaxID=2939690 RepID=A0ABT1XL72_9BURK|nr:efflux RND transporter periplasmic adaptor subunit [Limnobacter parvus]MCR2747032.1 efflux RND transporter periplasmic adaptor subunit [Limnobacter parvus]